MSPFEDGWLLELELLAVEIRLNDPRTQSVSRGEDDGNRADRNEAEDVLRARGSSQGDGSYRERRRQT